MIVTIYIALFENFWSSYKINPFFRLCNQISFNITNIYNQNIIKYFFYV